MSYGIIGSNSAAKVQSPYDYMVGYAQLNPMDMNVYNFQNTVAYERGFERLSPASGLRNQSGFAASARRDDMGLSEIRLEQDAGRLQQAEIMAARDMQASVQNTIRNARPASNMAPQPNQAVNQLPRPGTGNVTGAGQAQRQTGAGYQLLDQALKAGVITFDKGVEQQLYSYLGEALTKSPTMMRDFISDLNKGQTYSFGYRTGGQPSFATLNTNKNRIEFNTQDLFERAPYGPLEVAYHELYHSIYDVDHGQAHNKYIAGAIQEAGLKNKFNA